MKKRKKGGGVMGSKKEAKKKGEYLGRKEVKKENHDILLKKVLQAREAASFSLIDAAKKLEFKNYQTLSNIEKGERKINANELSAMARLYRRSLDYFFEPDIYVDPEPLWRKSTEADTTVDTKKVKREFLSFLENYSNMENLLGLKSRWKDIQKDCDKTDFSMRNFKFADGLGVEMGQLLNLGSRPAFNLLNVLEKDKRIKVLHLELENGISAASVVEDAIGVGILINAKEKMWRRNFDLAHELFHLVTWDVFTRDEVGDGTVKTKPEQYADAFASSLLLPEAYLLKALKEITTDNQIRVVDIIELAKDFGVSTDAILWRLVNLGILKRLRVKEIIEKPELRQTDRALRQDLSYRDTPPKFPSRYISIACRCLIEGKISRGVFAEYLEIDRADIDSYLAEQGFKEENYEKIAST